MAQAIEQELLQAIQYDDITAFDALMEQAPCGNYRLGRFPVLSLLYLYNARKIISVYENEFISISAWEQISEPVAIVKRFSEKAGKCLRLYFNKVVSPLEMLLILDKHKRLKSLFPQAKASDAVRARLKSIYYVKYSLGVKFEDGNIIIDRRPLSRKTKKKIIAAVVGGVLAVAAVIATPFSVVSYIQKQEREITSLNQIDFGAQKTYILKKDITVPENFSVKKVNCTIKGGGHKLALGKNASLGKFSGKLSNLEIQTFGSPIFTVCAKGSALSNITVSVQADVETKKDSAFIAVTNYGTFDGVAVNVSGSVYASDKQENTEGLIFGGMVAQNADYGSPSYGIIKNCSVHYSDFSLNGEIEANATFGGIVGINNGSVQDCSVSGEIVSTTFDLAGACYVNNQLLSGVVNGANLLQTSDADGWYPVVGGIVVENWSTVERCQNIGDITVEGQTEITCGGIAATTYGTTDYCISSGDITVTAKTAYVGGIFGISRVGTIDNYIYLGTADHCINQGSINATLGEGASYIGGIGGLVQESIFNQYVGNLIVGVVYLGGGITNCIFIGGVREVSNYFGNIVGACGVDIYQTNSYTLNGTTYINFDGNYYIENALPSFGTAVTPDGEFVRVDGKGITPSTENEIKTTETYKDIAKKLGL
ncbi:MAG: hypothetical protein J1F69_06200 [Clostridiales bacterium]|nr:hypothetical protein [Clostridiales bacterium]